MFNIPAQPAHIPKLLVREVVSVNDQAREDIAFLLEAYAFGQFADDMLDHPNLATRVISKPIRDALRRHLAWLETAAI